MSDRTYLERRFFDDSDRALGVRLESWVQGRLIVGRETLKG
jgi:hypothetical protein